MVITARNTKPKPGYKQTEVGVIPEDWQVKRLEELGVWKGGATPSMANASFWINGTIYWASSGDLKTKILSKTGSMITEIAVKQSNTTLLQEGAILIVTRSGILRKYLPVAKNTVPMAINQDIKALIPNSQVSADYLLQILSERGPDILSTCMKAGTTVESVEYTWLKKYQIPLPPPAEQRAIATALSDIDALIASLDRLIAKKRDIKQATMQHLLTGKTRLPGFSGELKPRYKQTEVGMIPEDWNTEILEGVCIPEGLVRGPFGGAIKKEFFVKDGFKVYEQKNAIYRDGDLGSYFISENKYKELKRFEVKEGDFIISCSGTIGKIFQVPKNAKVGVINQALLKIKTDSRVIHDQFFFYVFDWDKFQQKIIDNTQGGAMQNLVGMDIFRNISIPLPSLPEQRAIATILSDMDAEIAALEQKRDKTRALKQGMMQELLTGKTRLV